LPSCDEDSPHSQIERIRARCESIGLSGVYPLTGEEHNVAFSRTIVADLSLAHRRGDSSFVTANLPASLRKSELIEPCSQELERRVELEVESLFSRVAWGRSLFISQQGFMGLLPVHAKEGDLLCLLLGGDVLYVLRPKGEEFKFVGDCYIHGLMDGEALEGVNLETEKFKTFTLV
jgi:hypothetical protein